MIGRPTESTEGLLGKVARLASAALVSRPVDRHAMPFGLDLEETAAVILRHEEFSGDSDFYSEGCECSEVLSWMRSAGTKANAKSRRTGGPGRWRISSPPRRSCPFRGGRAHSVAPQEQLPLQA